MDGKKWLAWSVMPLRPTYATPTAVMASLVLVLFGDLAFAVDGEWSGPPMVDACCKNYEENYGALVVPLVAPIIALILGLIVGYSLRRILLARALYIDVDYRLRFVAFAVYRLEEELKKLRDWSSHGFPVSPPFITMGKEEHFVLPNIQEDLKICLWGFEADAVRLFYRGFQQIEHRAGKIEELYSELVKKYVESLKAEYFSLPNYRKCYVEQIDEQFKIIKDFAEFWLQTLWDHRFAFGKSLDPKLENNLAFPGAAGYLIYPGWVWYPTFIVIPFLAIALAFGGVLFLVVFHYSWHDVHDFITRGRSQSAVLAVAAFTMFVVLPNYLKWRGDRKIQEGVLHDFESRLLSRLHLLWPSSAQ